jgi:hypothetical protein
MSMRLCGWRPKLGGWLGGVVLSSQSGLELTFSAAQVGLRRGEAGELVDAGGPGGECGFEAALVGRLLE